MDKADVLATKGLTGQAKLGLAIIGLGRAGNFHLTSCASLSDSVMLRWVVDANKELADSVAERVRCRATTVVDDVLKDPQVEAVIIASTTNTHYGFCKAALQAGKHVFTEKPVSHNPHELKEVLDLALASGVAFIVGYQRRVDPNFRKLKEQVREGGPVGSLRVIKCCSRDNPLPPMDYLRTSGGIFCDMLCHDFDMIHFLSGQVPVEVYTTAHCYSQEIAAMDDVDTVVTTLTYASGLIATVDCSRTAPYGYDQRVEVFGDQGMATAQNQTESSVEVATSVGVLSAPAQRSFPERYRYTCKQIQLRTMKAYASFGIDYGVHLWMADTVEIAELVALIRAKGTEPEDLLLRHIDTERYAALCVHGVDATDTNSRAPVLGCAELRQLRSSRGD